MSIESVRRTFLQAAALPLVLTIGVVVGAAVAAHAGGEHGSEEIAVQRAAQRLLSDLNAHRWAQVVDDVDPACRTPDLAAGNIAKGWAGEGPFRLELRSFRLANVHDSVAKVDAQVYIVKPGYSSPFGPNHGKDPFLTTFVQRGNRWRDCD